MTVGGVGLDTAVKGKIFALFVWCDEQDWLSPELRVDPAVATSKVCPAVTRYQVPSWNTAVPGPERHSVQPP